jgi:prolyl-tRNA editing enzyme YbaK/EbsC (Cys-tRNA(Pro) deacylase)
MTGDSAATSPPPAGDHPNVRAVRAALAAHGASATIRLLPDAVATARAAADALGVEVGQIANSLVFSADGDPLLVLTSGAHRVDTAKVAGTIGAAALDRADAAFVRAATGQPIGGVAPVGHPAPLRTLVDTHLARFDEIWAAGGIPHAVYRTTFDELVRVTGGRPTEVN